MRVVPNYSVQPIVVMSTSIKYETVGDTATMTDVMSTLGMTGGTWRHAAGPMEDEQPHHSYKISDDEDDDKPDSSRPPNCEPIMSVSHSWSCNLPLVGRVQLLKDKEGLICSSIIVFYWVYGNYSTWMSILLPRYYDNQCPLIMLISEYFAN